MSKSSEPNQKQKPLCQPPTDCNGAGTRENEPDVPTMLRYHRACSFPCRHGLALADARAPRVSPAPGMLPQLYKHGATRSRLPHSFSSPQPSIALSNTPLLGAVRPAEASCLPWKATAMQEALVSPANAGTLRSALELRPFAFGDQRLASPRYLNLACGGDDALFRCSSPFSPSFGFSSPSPLATSSVSLSPSSSSSLVDDSDDAAAAAADASTGHRLQLARLALQYQEVADRYELCLARLAEAADDAAALRRENAELRAANGDLARRLALLSGIGKQAAAAAAIADEVRRLRFGEQKKAVAPAKVRAAPEKLAVLPKSISVRSNEYLKMNQPNHNQAPSAPAAHNRKPRASNPAKPSSRVYMGDGGVGKKGEEHKEQRAAGGVELEVYNQGMFKTELCNKWEETGACPYGDECQFAHGVAELRPVIRHPRYKTQVCRMVLAAEVCPYGHRCHFRHSLTAAERLLLPRP